MTGASRGIGRAIAERMASEGADLAICARSTAALEGTASAVSAAGRRVETYAIDLEDSAAPAEVVSSVVEALGRIDILVNNAGITHDTLLPRMTEEHWDSVMNVNLRGTFLFTKAVSRGMMKQKSGSIINISSVVGIMGNAGQCNYAASKAGIIGMTKSIARELASRKIRVNSVAPGFIETDMTAAMTEDAREKALANIPLSRLGTPDDVAAAVLFLASDAASYMTGQVVNVCGGMVMA